MSYATLRAIPIGMDLDAVGRIDTLLDEIQATFGVHIPLAVESGSRAWGFPSPDSDYDGRFVYVRPAGAHVTPWPVRDVIEFPPEQVLDVNGWDLAKAIRLLLKGNAVILEWLSSPIVYRADAKFRDALTDFARQVAPREAVGRHYLHLGERQRRVHFADGLAASQKRIFYALRPAAALRWLRLHPDQAFPPMNFPILMSQCDPANALSVEVDGLLIAKAQTRELSVAPLSPNIAAFIDNEFELGRQAFEGSRVIPTDAARAEAAAFYRSTVERLDLVV